MINEEAIDLGPWTEEDINRLLKYTSLLDTPAQKISFLSSQFLLTPYGESTLIGNRDKEIFTINLDRVDCFTFIEYIEAMRISGSFNEFRENLKKIRYKSGVISFKKRNHFFTDWRIYNKTLVKDVTHRISDNCSEVWKSLNKKDRGEKWIPYIPVVRRKMRFIKSRFIHDQVIKNLQTGDYAGIYSDDNGLDVSHVGIIIKYDDVIFFRHASSHKARRRVIDEDFKEYISKKPGLIVFRPIPLGTHRALPTPGVE
jgi:hypothetical protein